jgi:transposase
MHTTTLGIDVAKNVFQLHGVGAQGRAVLSRRVRRQQLLDTVANLPACVIEMEACGSAHYWGRAFEQVGHRVKLMSPKYVEPYVKTNKNDRRDAEAICEAVSRPTMRFVAIKTVDQADLQAVHRSITAWNAVNSFSRRFNPATSPPILPRLTARYLPPDC